MLGKSVSKVILFFRDDLVGRSISKLDLVPDRKWISKQDLIDSGVCTGRAIEIGRASNRAESLRP